jgi:hypothetical protein
MAALQSLSMFHRSDRVISHRWLGTQMDLRVTYDFM